MAKSARTFSPKLISLAVASCFAAGTALANPTGPTVVNGQVSVQPMGNLLQITNSPNSIINWQSFSIGAGEITKFIQQSASSAVLNRVTGAGGSIDPSVILGALQSNGRVFLINPSGITFGAGSQIDVAGLVASSLNLSNQDFLNGKFAFAQVPGAGAVVNQGNINAGQVYLVGPSVTNSGVITSPSGEVVLAAGNSVELVNPGTPNLRVEIAASDNQAVNLGQIVADAGRVGIYAGLVRQGGTVRADSAQVTDDGRIVLKGTKNVTVDAGSVTSASGAKGGTIEIEAGERAMVFGSVAATGSEGKGGTVHVLGNLVGVMDGASIDASGQSGGGTVLVGGDYRGQNAAIQNAYRTVFAPGATIKADALGDGDGGKVVVWADDGTRAYGTISARGGSQGGNGGFVEVSGKGWLDFHASVDTGAPKGKTGTLLLDPSDVQIFSGTCCGAEGNFVGGSGPNDPFVWSNNNSNQTLASVVLWGDTVSPGTIIYNLQTNNVIVTTSSGRSMAGDLTVVNGATYSSDNFLSLIADRHLVVNPGVNITNNGNGDINLLAGGSIGIGTCVLCAPSGAVIQTGGNIVMSAGGNIDIFFSNVTAGRSNSGRDSFLLIGAGGNVTVTNSFLQARGSDACCFDSPGAGILSIAAGGNIGIFDSTIQGIGGQADIFGALGQVSISAGGNLTIDQPNSNSTFIYAQGGQAFGAEGGSGGNGVIFLAANGALTMNGSSFVLAQGGPSSSGVGGAGQISLFGGSVSVNGVGGCCSSPTLEANGNSGFTAGGAASINVFSAGNLLLDGPEGITAFGGFGNSGRGGDAAITIASGGAITNRNNSFIRASAGSGNTGGGNASVGISALGDIFSLDSHIEASGGFTGGTAVVAMTSTLGGIVVDGSGASAPATVLAFASGNRSEVNLQVFDILSVNRDRVEASAGEGGTAAINVFFTGRSTGGMFVNGVEGPPFSVTGSSPIAFTPGDGFFVNGDPAQLGVNLFVTYANTFDPCRIAPEICQAPRTEPPPVTEAQQPIGTGKKDKDGKEPPVCGA